MQFLLRPVIGADREPAAPEPAQPDCAGALHLGSTSWPGP